MTMDQIKELYAAMKRADSRLSAATQEMEQAQKDYDRLSKDLGDLLHVLNLSEVKMSDGKTIGLKTKYFGNTAQERINAIREYLKARNSEGILKPKKLNITEDVIDVLPDELKERVSYEINPNTLRAFLNELAKKNELTQDVRELFAVHQENKVVLQ